MSESNYTEPFNPQETEGIEDNGLCKRCQCCSVDWQDCDTCGGEGVDGHDCGEDCCCCLNPEDNQTCDICDGYGGSYACLGGCDKDGKHKAERVGISDHN